MATLMKDEWMGKQERESEGNHYASSGSRDRSGSYQEMNAHRRSLRTLYRILTKRKYRNYKSQQNVTFLSPS